MSGYLKYKKGWHGWKKLWFMLKDNVLYGYKASSVSVKVTLGNDIDLDLRPFSIARSEVQKGTGH